ncbi:hypothetical protein KQI63_05465 [bacterium]|nr:hypothetical protein [bacterium]
MNSRGMGKRAILACALLLTGFFLLLPVSQAWAQPSDQYEPSDQRGVPELRRFTNMDGNSVRVSVFNTGLSGAPAEWPEAVNYEYPKNTDRIYISIVGIWPAGEVVDENGNTIQMIDMPMWRTSPSGDSWNMEPIQGFLNPSHTDLARSDDPETWPPQSEGGWRDKRDDIGDPGWVGSWNGFFGKNIFNADLELFYRTGDDNYDRYNYQPDETDPTRAGLGLLMDVRTLAWTQILINDVVFFVHDIKNDGTKRIPKASFLIFLADYVGGDGTDDEPYVDIQTDVAFLTDYDRIGTEAFGSDPVGVAAVKYLETPGNQVDGIDNDGDADHPQHAGILNGILPDPSVVCPLFTASDFESRFIGPGQPLVLIDDETFNRVVINYPSGGGTVVTQGREIDLPAGGMTVREDTLANALDDDFDGLIDERETIHLSRFDEITGTEVPVRFINYLSFAVGDTIKRGFVVPGTDAVWNYENVAPLIDESRDDGFDNDGDWDLVNDDVGLDGVKETFDTGEGDGVPSSGTGTDFPGEPNIDKTDVTETDVIGLTAANQVQVGTVSYNSADQFLWNRFMIPGQFVLPRPVGEYDTFVSSGFFPIEPGERQRMAISVAISAGGINRDADIQGVINKQAHALDAYSVDYQFAQAPIKPNLKAVPGDGKVTLYWDDVSEASIDRYIESVGGDPNDFEGYRVYRATDPAMEDARTITDAYGNPILLRPIAQFDKIDGIYGLHPVDINGIKYNLGNETGLQHSWVDEDVTNGQRYFYAVVGYDFGFELANIAPSESPIQIDVDQQGNIRHGSNVAVVRPTAPAAGYLPPGVTWFEHSEGGATGTVEVLQIVDPDAIKDGHTYEITFRDTVYTGTSGDTLTTRDYSVFDVTESGSRDTLLANSRLFNEDDRIPILDGFELAMSNEPFVMIDEDTSGWNDPEVHRYAFEPVTYPGVRGERRPKDYRLIIGEGVQSTSYDTTLGSGALAFDLPSIGVNFRLEHILTGNPVAFAYADLYGQDGLFNVNPTNGDQTDILFLLEDDGQGGLSYTWQISLLLTNATRDPIAGDTLEVRLSKPFLSSDVYRFQVEASEISTSKAKVDLDRIRVVPNPYVAAESWEVSNPYTSGRGPREIHFINLPKECTIRIFDVSGTLIDQIEHSSQNEDGTAIWDVLSKEGLSISYGIYLYHVKAKGIGEKTGTFGVIK